MAMKPEVARKRGNSGGVCGVRNPANAYFVTAVSWKGPSSADTPDGENESGEVSADAEHAA